MHSTPKTKRATRHPRAKCIFVDVDGTLLLPSDRPNLKLIAKLRAYLEKGFMCTLWSARGEDYAREVATKLDCTNLFSHIIGKPGYIFDDKGWKWTRYTKALTLTK